METINNLNTYCTEMNKGIEDKLWFIQFLKTFNSFNKRITIYDWGCANGELLQHLAPMFPNINFIGVDINEDMLNEAMLNNKYDNVNFMSPKILWCDDYAINIVIMSSLFHELISYNTFKEFYETMMISIKPDYIFFRDMMINKSTKRYANPKDLDKTGTNPNYTKEITEFIIHEITDYVTPVLQRNLIHFLLKYRFKENWNREVKENYLPVYLEDLHNYFPDFDIIYYKHYTLPFIKEQVKKDFDIDLMDKTHVNIIFKLKDNKANV